MNARGKPIDPDPDELKPSGVLAVCIWAAPAINVVLSPLRVIGKDDNHCQTMVICLVLTFDVNTLLAVFQAMVAITTTAVISQTPHPKKTRRGGSAAKRSAKAREATSSGGNAIEIDNGDEDEEEDEQVMIDVTAPSTSHDGDNGPAIAITQIVEDEEGDVPMGEETNDDSAVPTFAPLSASAQSTSARSETRRVPIPPHRFGPLKNDWVNIYSPLTEILGLQVRMNVQRKSVEIRVGHFHSLRNLLLQTHVCLLLDFQAYERHRCSSERRRLCQSIRSWLRRSGV